MKRNMDRKLRDAYDKMTMPEDCAQRIEKLLLEGTKTSGKHRNEVILRQKSRWQTWGSAAALVCLAVLISLGSVSLFAQKQQELPQNLQPTGAGAETTTNPEDGEEFALSEEGREFLLAMCYAMPDWENYYVLDEQFWENFLFASFTCPEEVKGSRAKTIIGQVPFEDGMVLISRKQAEDYAALTMGCDLPELNPGGAEDSTGIQYYDGYYHIHVSDFGSRSYQLRKWVSYSAESCDVMFNAYVDGDTIDGSVRFRLRKADNENGFLIVSKQSEFTLPEEKVRLVTGQDQDAILSEGKDVFQQSVRGTTDYTAHQYHLPWSDSRLRSSQLCIVYEDEDGYIESKPYILENGSWKEMETETKQLNCFCTDDGKEWEMPYSYIETEEGIWYELGPSVIENFAIDYCVQNPGRNPWWIAYQWEEPPDSYVTHELGITAGPWRLDPATGELTDLWGNVPEENRVSGIQWYFSDIQFFTDGCFLIPSMDGDRELHMLYVDPEAGQVYDLKTLCGTELDDYIGSTATDEIYCWKDGEYWRIPRDSLRPEYLGKLQEDVVFASGVLGGQWATFSIERLEEGGYRIYDYVGNRFLTLENFPNPYGNPVDWDRVEASPDGRKLLTSQATSLLQVLDCDAGKLLTVERKQNSTSGDEVGWLMSGEVYVKTLGWEIRDYVIYTLK